MKKAPHVLPCRAWHCIRVRLAVTVDMQVDFGVLHHRVFIKRIALDNVHTQGHTTFHVARQTVTKEALSIADVVESSYRLDNVRTAQSENNKHNVLVSHVRSPSLRLKS